MFKSDYDSNDDGAVDDSALLEGSDLAEVQYHTPKSHSHPPGATGQYVDRGDPSSWDKGVGDFTTDNTWRLLDLGLIVPDGAIAINVHLQIKSTAADHFINLRKSGLTNAINKLTCRCQVANEWAQAYGIVACTSDRKLDYRGTTTAFTEINLVVCGWLL